MKLNHCITYYVSRQSIYWAIPPHLGLLWARRMHLSEHLQCVFDRHLSIYLCINSFDLIHKTDNIAKETTPSSVIE